MRYLIIAKGFDPYRTKWYDHENHFNPELDMIVIDLSEDKFTDDGKTWKEIEFDHL